MRKKYPVDIQLSGLEVRISPREILSPKVGYWLTYRDTVPATAKMPAQDTVFRYPVTWLSPEDLGTLQGTVVLDSTYAGPVIVQLLNGQNTVIRTAYDTAFVFSHLPAGSYTARVILDADGNRAFSPGSLRRYRLPERVYLDSQKITIRANWDTEGHIIQVGATAAPQKAGGGGAPVDDQPPAGRRTPGKG
jgi:hypothetical protein